MRTAYRYFDDMYRVPDPWSFETSGYERGKYATTLAALGDRRYRRAFEPGCSIGVLTGALATRADEVLAADLHPAPVAAARARLAGTDGVRVERLDVPAEWPSGTFDLIVISELAYYFDESELDQLVDRVRSSLEPGGDLVLVHWRGETDYPQGGDAVHERWLRAPGFHRVRSHRNDEFRLDVLRAGSTGGRR